MYMQESDIKSYENSFKSILYIRSIVLELIETLSVIAKKRLLHLPKKSKASIQLPRHWEAKSRHRVCCQKIEGAEQKCRKKNAPKISVGSLF